MNAPLPPIRPPTRRGACPALSAPMRTGDGLLVRLSLTEGGLVPATLAALCEAAIRHGNGLVEITARGSFQARGLTAASAPLFADAVNALAFPLREGVPVETSPLAGLDPLETADPLPLVRAIRTAIADAGLSRRLGPKVSVVVDGGGQIALDSVAADVRVEAVSAGEWRVSVADKTLGIMSDEAPGAAVEALGAIAVAGMAARGRDLSPTALAGIASRLGILPTLPPSVLPDISPSGGEIGRHDGRRFSLDGLRKQAGSPISPPEGEMSGRTEGGAKGRPHLGLLPLRDDLAAITVALPFGQCDATALAALAENAAGIADFRFAPGRRLLALGPRDACAALHRHAAALGFVTDPADPRLSVAACPGAPACASGHFSARDFATRVAAMLPPSFAGIVHVSGCAKGCAHPARADLVLAGTSAGIAVMRDARAAEADAASATDPQGALDLLRALADRAAA